MLKKITLAIVILLVIVEIVSAPIEWFWPVPWGGNTHWRAERSDKVLALTFDDGPSAYTNAVLDSLKAHNARATFFVMGQEVERYPDIVKRMTEEGHEIGNHTYNFAAQKNIFFSGIDVNDIKRNQDIIEQYAGQRPKFYRSPGGQTGRYLFEAIKQENLQVVNGLFPMAHPDLNAQEQFDVVVNAIKPGAIIILHDGDDHFPDSERPKATAELMPLLLTEMERQGYRSVTVSELLNKK